MSELASLRAVRDAARAYLTAHAELRAAYIAHNPLNRQDVETPLTVLDTARAATIVELTSRTRRMQGKLAEAIASADMSSSTNAQSNES